MSVYFEYLQHVYKILSERERIRLDCSRPQKTPGYPTPEQVFYSVANSLNFRTSNRYYNILAYDRTVVGRVSGQFRSRTTPRGLKGTYCRRLCQTPFMPSFELSIRARPRRVQLCFTNRQMRLRGKRQYLFN